jgi:hypothetical protein
MIAVGGIAIDSKRFEQMMIVDNEQISEINETTDFATGRLANNTSDRRR